MFLRSELLAEDFVVRVHGGNHSQQPALIALVLLKVVLEPEIGGLALSITFVVTDLYHTADLFLQILVAGWVGSAEESDIRELEGENCTVSHLLHVLDGAYIGLLAGHETIIGYEGSVVLRLILHVLPHVINTDLHLLF